MQEAFAPKHRRKFSAQRVGVRAESLEPRTLLSLELVRDINLTPAPTPTLAGLTDVNGTLFFAGTDVAGTELWKSDGTEAGTARVKDIAPGAQSSAPGNLTRFNNLLLFTASHPIKGRSLWRSDGTDAGTFRLAGIYPPSTEPLGIGSSYPFVSGGDAAYFFAWETEPGRQLWRTDGTVAGTRLVATIPRPTSETTGTVPRGLTYVNGTLYFAVDGDDAGMELWKSDGTQVGTSLVKDINPGAAGSSPANLTNVNGTLFFTATDPVAGLELWKSDGTEAGTVLVKDVRPGTGPGLGPNPTAVPSLTNVGGTLYFAANDGVSGVELWKSNGTGAGTVMVKDINPGATASTPTNLTAVGNIVYFAATHPATGRELWRSDGTDAGTYLVKDLFGGFPGSNQPAPDEIIAAGDTLYIVTRGSGSSLQRLWRSDGMPGGTMELHVFTSPTSFPAPPGKVGLLTASGTSVFFSGYDDATGFELWKSDGTVAGTRLLKDVYDFNASSLPSTLGVVNGRLVISASDGGAFRKLYATDGGPDGLQLLKSIPASGGTLLLNDTLYFGATNPSGSAFPMLWKSDGTAAGTTSIKSFSALGNVVLSQFTEFGGNLYFTSEQRGGLWKSDGTEVGTTEVFSNNAPNTLQIIGAVGGQFLFGGHGPYEPGVPQSLQPYGIWKTDGTREGTALVMALKPGVFKNRNYFVKLNDDAAVFFATNPASPDQYNTVLWRTDGTTGGTAIVADLFPGEDWSPNATSGGLALGPGVLGGKMYFRAADNWLWVTDGTTAGTRKVADVTPNDLTRFVEFQGAVFFISQEGTAPNLKQYLYRTDGTAAGTIRVGDIKAAAITPIGGALYVSGTRPGSPSGIWKTDGTDANFTLVSHMSGGVQRQFGDWIYLRADDGTRGTELWRASAAGPTAPPAVVESRFDSPPAGPQRLMFRMENGVGFSPRTSQLLLTNVSTGETVSPLLSQRAYDSVSHTITFTFPYQYGGRLAGGNWRATLPAGVVYDAAAGDPLPNNFEFVFTAPGVVARHIFYNNSAFDGRDPAADARDDAAIASDKLPLRALTEPGSMHYTSYSRGINGIMVDLAGLAPGIAPLPTDFTLEMSTPGAPGAWEPAPQPTGIGVRAGAGVGGSDRVTLLWPDGAIRNRWLRVTVKPSDRTGQGLPDVFQFGNLVGETGNETLSRVAVVNAFDIAATRRGQIEQVRSGLTTVPITNRFDHNRDGTVNALDAVFARQRHGTASLPMGETIGPPFVASVTSTTVPRAARDEYRPATPLFRDAAPML